jgi:hypothetical protein
MTFPVLTDYPIYNITLPSSGKKVSFRPFLEKERKVLLMAYESNNDKDILDAIVNIIKGCVQSEINVNDLSVVDVEYFFLQLRAKSMGEIVKLNYKCNNEVAGKLCGNIMTTEVDISQVDIGPSPISSLIKLSPTLSVQMKHPNFIVTQKLVQHDKDYIYKLVASAIDFVANDKSVLHAKDYPIDDMVEFILGLTPGQFAKLEEYVHNLPVLKKQFSCTCKSCGYVHDITIEGYQSFFL